MSNNLKKFACVLGALVGVAIIIIGVKIQNCYFSEISTPIIWSQMENGTLCNSINAVTREVGGAIHDAVKKTCELVGWILISVGAIDASVFIYKLCSSSKTVTSADISLNNGK